MHCAATAVVAEMHMVFVEFGWLGMPETGFRPRNKWFTLFCSYISCFKYESYIYNKYICDYCKNL